MAGWFGDSEAGLVVFGETGDFMEIVTEVEAAPAVGGMHDFVHLNVKFAKFLDIFVHDFGIVEKIIEIGKVDLPVEYDSFSHFAILQLFVEVIDHR